MSRLFFLAFRRQEYTTDPLIIGEFLPLLLRQETEAVAQGRRSTLQAALRADHPDLRRLTGQHRAQNGATPADFDNPEFDTLIKGRALESLPRPLHPCRSPSFLAIRGPGDPGGGGLAEI